MAEIVLGLGTSHSPLLSVPGHLWAQYAQRDQHNPWLFGTDGQKRSYHELLETASPAIAQELTPEKFQQRDALNQRGIARVAAALAEAAPDILVMVGDDQEEVFTQECMPALCIFWGDTVPFQVRRPREGDTPMRALVERYGKPEVSEYPVAADLALHTVRRLTSQGFDVMHCRRPGEGRSMSHAFGFVWRRIMGDRTIPTVPIHLNTYYPPNQPTPHRCYKLGQALRKAIEAWPSQARVAVLASGGLSHFVVDEELDHRVLQALQDHDVEAMASLPLERLNAGSSEIRNWIALAGAMEERPMELFHYVPCYRSPAGTGCAMAFAQWV